MRKYVVQIVTLFLLLSANSHIASTREDLPDLALQAITKTHSEIIHESPHSWKISVGGDTPAAGETSGNDCKRGDVYPMGGGR